MAVQMRDNCLDPLWALQGHSTQHAWQKREKNMMPATWADIRHHTFRAEGNLSLVCLPLMSCPDRYQWVSVSETLASGQTWPKVPSTQQGGTKCWGGGFSLPPHPSQASPDGPLCQFYPSRVPINRRCLTFQVWGRSGRRQVLC